MVMEPLIIITTIRAGLDFGAKFLDFLQTEQGQKVMARWLEDDAKRREDWGKFVGWIENLFGGKFKLEVVPEEVKLTEKKPGDQT